MRPIGGGTEFEVILLPKDKPSIESALHQVQEAGGSEALNLAFLNLLKLIHKYGTEETRLRVKLATQHVNSIISRTERGEISYESQ